MDMHSGFELSQADPRPMYLQIIERIKQRIVVGDWPVGTELPSIRQLAAACRVSVITTKRAYLELEREGVIRTQHGKGSTVASVPGDGRERWDAELDRHVGQLVQLARCLGLSAAALAERVRRAMDESGDEGAGNE